MKPNTNQHIDQAPHIDQAELEASLARLGIRELEERMEISPLLADTGTMDKDMPAICCTCKIPDPFGPDGTLPMPTINPWPTGPTNPNGF